MLDDVAALAHANYMAALAQLGAAGATVERRSPWFFLDCGPGFEGFRRALLTGRPSDAGLAIDAARAWFEARFVEEHRLLLRAGADAQTLAEAARRGYAKSGEEPVMVRSLTSSAGAGRANGVGEAVSESDLEGYATLEAASAEERDFRLGLARSARQLPGCRLFVARSGHAVIGRAMLLAEPPIAGLYNVFVAPEARRQGVATALTITALERARADGCTTAALAATSDGYAVYRHLGFEVIDSYVSLDSPRGRR